MRSASRLIITFFATVFLPTHFLFAAVPTDSLSDSAGAEQTRFETEDELKKQDERVVLRQAEVSFSDEKDLSAPVAGDVTFTLKQVRFTGNESVSTDDLNAVVESYLGREVSLANLQEIAQKVKRFYRKQGFIAAFVYVPPQNITDGMVEIAVAEGKVGTVEITNNRWFSEKALRKLARLTLGNVLFFTDLKRSLDLVNKHPDVKARAVLKPGQEKATTDVELIIEEQFPVHFTVDVNNLGTDNTGKTRTGFALTHTNLLGLLDQLSTRFQIGSRSWAVGADYNLPINSYGTVLGLSYSHSSVDVGGPFEALDLEGRASTYSIYVDQPFRPLGKYEMPYGMDWTSSLRVGFDFKDIENESLGSIVGEDDLRILNLQLNNEIQDKWGKTFLPQSFHFGFSSFLGANRKNDPNASRAGSTSQFSIYRGSAIRYNRLPWGMMLALRSSWQLSNDRLPPSEQLRLGGAFSVRGYPEGDYLADYGGFLSTELYVPSYFFPKDWKLPYSKMPLRNQIQGTAFFDFGYGELRKHLTGESENKSLAGTGLGVRIHLFDRVYARLQWAMPTGSRASDGANSAFYYGVSAELL